MSKEKPARIFFGLPINQGSVDDFKQRILKQDPNFEAHFRWVKPGNCHITMRFVGNIDPEKIPELIAATLPAIHNIYAFSATAQKIDLFPPRRARMLALYIEPIEPLKQLFHQLERCLATLDYSPERQNFLPHATLCRKRDNKNYRFKTIELSHYQLPITELVLFQSQPEEGGMVYNPLHRYKL